jgi:hypothetical protein
MFRSLLSRVFPSPVYAFALGGQVVLLMVGLQTGLRAVWLPCLGGIALLSLFTWVIAFRRRRAILDTPTSKIVSAAQGYVELQGVGQTLEGVPLNAPLSGIVCLWYRYRLEERTDNNEWKEVESGVSSSCFLLNDGTGQCLVDPEGAEVLTQHYRSWTDQDRRCHEWLLHHRDKVCALGDFVTLRQSDELNADEDINALLAEWKKDQPALLRRFDLNHDGQIDLKEWEWARRAARNEVAKRHQEARRQDDLNMMRASKTRLFLITNYEPSRLTQRFLWLGMFELATFFVALGYLGRWWRHG